MHCEIFKHEILPIHFHTQQIPVIEVLTEQHVHHPGEIRMLHIISKIPGYL